MIETNANPPATVAEYKLTRYENEIAE